MNYDTDSAPRFLALNFCRDFGFAVTFVLSHCSPALYPSF
jgi:hypothetical protein